jgi:protocatechuate 3,4-dioxygenase beta subunit
VAEQIDNDDIPVGRVLSRKKAITLIGGAGLMTLVGVGCGGSSSPGSTITPTSTPTPAPSGSATPTPTPSPTASVSPTPTPTPVATGCTLIPTETQGPYPLLSVLGNSAIVRKDITEGKAGVPLTLTLNLVNVNESCGPIVGAAVYIWHCDKDGAYSGYSSGANGSHSGETFLRGIQVTNSSGQVTFTTIYPGWYAGRITHIHFQVYLNDNLNVTATATSQLAFPQDVTAAVYNSSLYAARGQNTSVTSFAQDNVFSDGTTYEMATISGDTANGYAAALTVGIAAS